MRTETHTPDGIEIITRGEARAPHPRWGETMIVPFAGVTELLLADGNTAYECDRCGIVKPTVRQVVSHMPAHTRDYGPMYDEATLRAVIRAVLIVKRDHPGARDYMQRAADALNAAGKHTPTHSNEWTPANVSSLFRRYSDELNVRVYRKRTTRATLTQAAEVAPAAEVTAYDPTADDAIEQLAAADANALLNADATAAVVEIINLARRIITLADSLEYAEPVAPDIIEKAKNFDAFRNLIQPFINQSK